MAPVAYQQACSPHGIAVMRCRSIRVHCTAPTNSRQLEAPGRRALLSAGLALGLAAVLPARHAAADEGSPTPITSRTADAADSQQQGSGSGAPVAESAVEQSPVPLSPEELERQAAAKLLEEEGERRKARRRKKGRIRELEEIRAELAEKELVLLEKEKELLEKDQTVIVLREELEIEKKLRVLLTKEKEKAEEEATLAMGLCTGGSMLP